MLVLAVESATNVASAALVSGTQVVAEFNLNDSKTHSEKLMPLVAQVMEFSGVSLQDLDGIAVSIGPGSFTGLRIGLASVKALAFFYDKPVVGIPTLDGLARSVVSAEGLLCPVLTARKDEIYCALYIKAASGLERLSNYMAVSPKKLLSLISKIDHSKVTFVGDGLELLPPELLQDLGTGWSRAASEQNYTRAALVGLLGVERLTRNEPDDLSSLTPFYIRPSAAEAGFQSDKNSSKGGCSWLTVERP